MQIGVKVAREDPKVARDDSWKQSAYGLLGHVELRGLKSKSDSKRSAGAAAVGRRVAAKRKVAAQGVAAGRGQRKSGRIAERKERQSTAAVVGFPAIAPMKLYSKQSKAESMWNVGAEKEAADGVHGAESGRRNVECW